MNLNFTGIDNRSAFRSGHRRRRCRKLCQISTCALLAFISVAHAQNLIENGGFEDGPRPDCGFIGLHWDAVEHGCQGSVQELSSTLRHSGLWSQKLGASPSTDFGWLRQVSDYNSVQEGKTYVISAWIKSTVTDGWGWNVFRIEVLNNDSTLWHLNMPQQESPNYDWRLITWQETVPAGSGINRIGASLTRHWQNGEVWYDDISITELTTGQPEISIAPSSITRVAYGPQSPAADTFVVQNVGGGTLDYTVSSNAAWVAPDPVSGSSIGEDDTITLNYTTTGLSAGTYVTTVDVHDPEAVVPTVSLDVSLTIAAPGDFDLDEDVDLDDFAVMQACLSGIGIPQQDPSCQAARLDVDPDVDTNDLDLFLTCLSGANMPAPLDCAGL